jgi:hypothetical protein
MIFNQLTARTFEAYLAFVEKCSRAIVVLDFARCEADFAKKAKANTQGVSNNS